MSNNSTTNTPAHDIVSPPSHQQHQISTPSEQRHQQHHVTVPVHTSIHPQQGGDGGGGGGQQQQLIPQQQYHPSNGMSPPPPTTAQPSPIIPTATSTRTRGSVPNTAVGNGDGSLDVDAIVSFLRMEARHAEERARNLREYADKLLAGEAGTPDYELAPLDENGVPKYKGKKRGRKPKKRKRMRNPNAPKRKHTAYTLYVQETYPQLKSQFPQPEYQSKDIIAMVARQWQNVPENEKKSWKQRAKLASSSASPDVNNNEGRGLEFDDDEEDDDEDEHHNEDGADNHHENENVEDVVNQLVGINSDGNSIMVGNNHPDLNNHRDRGGSQEVSMNENTSTMHHV